MPVAKAIAVDSLSRCRIVVLGLLFYVLFFVGLGVSYAGPSRLASSNAVITQAPQPACGVSCIVSLQATVSGLTPLNQFLSVSLDLARPLASDNSPLLLPFGVEADITFSVDMRSNDGSNTVLTTNATHTRHFSWSPGANFASVPLLYIAPLSVPSVAIDLKIVNPFAAFAGGSVSLQPQLLNAALPITTVAEGYSVFELTWRAFLCTTSILTFILYSSMLFCAPGAKNAQGQRLPSSVEQQWVWWLSLLLIPFNDPLFAVQILVPTLAASAFSGLMTVSFLAVLLFFWLVHFHVAALQAEGGIHWELDGTRNRLGVMFWLPKAVLITLFWVTALSLYMYSRYMSLTDPAYQVSEAFSSISQYFIGFAFTVTAIYLLYLLVLVVLGLRHFRKMREGNRFFLALTLSTVIVIVAGVFADAFVSNVDGTNAAFAVSYLIANLYVAWLCIAYLPAKRDSAFDNTMARESVNAETAVDTTGVMAASADLDVESSELDLGDGGAAQQATTRAAARVDRRRTAATAASSNRGTALRSVAVGSSPPTAGPSFTIAEEADEESGNIDGAPAPESAASAPAPPDSGAPAGRGNPF